MSLLLVVDNYERRYWPSPTHMRLSELSIYNNRIELQLRNTILFKLCVRVYMLLLLYQCVFDWWWMTNYSYNRVIQLLYVNAHIRSKVWVNKQTNEVNYALEMFGICSFILYNTNRVVAPTS